MEKEGRFSRANFGALFLVPRNSHLPLFPFLPCLPHLGSSTKEVGRGGGGSWHQLICSIDGLLKAVQGKTKLFLKQNIFIV
jgi:hypothetical protein